MTYFDSIETKQLTLCNGDGEPVCDIDLVPNNEHPLPGETTGRVARIRIKMRADYPFELWCEPGDDADVVGNIINQIGLFGLVPKPGEARKRLTFSMTSDGDGGVAAVVDSTTTDPSGDIGQKAAAPLVVNVGEAKGIYLILYPGDNTIAVQDRMTGSTTQRVPIQRLIKLLREDS